MQKKLIKVYPSDNVAVALIDLAAGDMLTFEGETIEIIADIKAKQKIALNRFNKGDNIIMYGVLVGKSNCIIEKGGVLTIHNVKHESQKVNKKTGSITWIAPNVDKWENRTFLGYPREDGQVGTSNIWLFFPLVFCENRNIEILKEAFEKEFHYQKESNNQLLLRYLVNAEEELQNNSIITSANVFDNVEVKFITHQGGCGAIRQDAEALAKLLAGYVNNPNVAGATVLSLGCQNLQIELFTETLKSLNPESKKPILIFEQQKMGTVDNMINAIIIESFEAIKKANEIKRQPTPLSKLKVGLECGGSDGFSGISANPVVGYTSDLLVSLKATVILSEFPELCGVEQEIVNRCVDENKAFKFLKLMKDFEKSVVDAAGSGFDMNPSPGNIKDGLITDAMKSAGAAKKGGNSPVIDVLDYGEYVSNSGLNLLCTPGNDVESTTAMVGSGANIVLFTTGLGTPTGNPIAPVIKISSNSELANKMPDIIDIDTGSIINGERTIEEMATQLLDFIIEVASGRIKTKTTLLHQNDFIPWRKGVSL